MNVTNPRVLIVCDGEKWFVREVSSIAYDLVATFDGHRPRVAHRLVASIQLLVGGAFDTLDDAVTFVKKGLTSDRGDLEAHA